jgi:hypothetical protein
MEVKLNASKLIIATALIPLIIAPMDGAGARSRTARGLGPHHSGSIGETVRDSADAPKNSGMAMHIYGAAYPPYGPNGAIMDFQMRK